MERERERREEREESKDSWRNTQGLARLQNCLMRAIITKQETAN